MPRSFMCGLFGVGILISPMSSRADPKLDEMQRMIENDGATLQPRAPELSGKPGSVLNRAWNTVCSGGSAINSDLRRQYSLLDNIETDLEKSWTSIEQASMDAINAWPFPHAYWAPGVTQDATETVMDAAEKAVESDAVDPGPSPSANPETE
jgi:hypothetical protein